MYYVHNLIPVREMINKQMQSKNKAKQKGY